MHSLMNLTVFIVNLSTLCSYLCILHLKWCVYQFIIIIIIIIIIALVEPRARVQRRSVTAHVH